MLSKKPKILIIGKGRHGKDTVAEILLELTDLKFTSSSWFLAEIIFEQFGGYSVYPSVEDCFNDRHNHREEWFNFVRAYNQGDESRLAQEILTVSDVYVGLRSLVEFQAARHLFDFIFYVEASKRVDYVDETFEIPLDRQMIVIANNSTLEDLKHQVKIASEIVQGKANLLSVDPGNWRLKRLLQTKAPWE